MRGRTKIVLFTGAVFALTTTSAAVSVMLNNPSAEPTVDSSGSSFASGRYKESSSSDSLSEVVSMTDINRNDWNLILVNPAHSVPDGYNVALSAVQSNYQMDERVSPYMIEMIDAAKKDGINLWVLSTYRTYEYQQGLFNRNVQELKSAGMTEEEAVTETAANIAVPGTSEHHTGLAADVMCAEWTGGITEDFAETDAYKWLHEHCAEYGFIERYPQNKTNITGIVYEPWHYRFVGKEHAEVMMKQGITLEEYLGVR